jgi:signal peptidase II
MEDSLKKYIKDYAFLLIIAGIIVGLDQWTKVLVRNQIPFSESWSPFTWLAPYARIVHWNNTGAAFGLFQGYNLVFSVLAVGVSIAILYYFPRIPSQDWVIRVALSMQLGGAVGNLIDRVVMGTVTDFISVGNFAVFNVADSSISVGVAILLLAVLYKDWQEKKTAQNKTEDVTPSVEKSQLSEGGGQEIHQ